MTGHRLVTRLADRRTPIAVTILAFVLALPSLRLGLSMDDLFHRAILQHDRTWLPATRAPWDLFSFAKGGGAERAAIIDKGMLPWWISEDIHVAFFRPVSSLSHVLDYALFPSSPAMMHLVSVLWYAGLAYLAAVMYRRFLGRTNAAPWICGLAALLYAVDGTHGLPVGWLANRNALIAAVFALAALQAHDAKRPFVSALLLALALGSGESAVAILAYFAAHAVFLDERSWAEKAKAFVPAAVITVAWAINHRIGGWGVRGSSLYFDPKHSPLGFLTNLTHLPILAGAELGAPTPDLYPFVPFAARAFFMTCALAVIAAALFAGRHLLARSHPRSKEARFFLVSGIVALVPACSTMPSARLLLISGFGLVGFLAMLAEEQTKAARRYLAWAVGVRLLLSPIVFTIHEHQMALTSGRVDTFGATIPMDPSVEDKRLVLFNAPDAMFAYYMIANRVMRDEPAPHTLLTLAGGYRDVTVTRTGERTLVVRVAEGFYRRDTDLLFRSLDEVTPVGSQIATTDFTVTTTHALPDGVIDEARYDLREPLESPHWLFMEWHGKALVPATLPAMGETRTLRGIPMLSVPDG
jgi:hypothetical protein